MKAEHIAVAWNGLPAYGAHLIQGARLRVGYDFPVIGTRPDVPIWGMEKILNENLYWVKADQIHSWEELGLNVPRLFIHTGWGYAHFISLANEVRAQGGKVVGLFDNSWKGTLRQYIGVAYFRTFLRRKYIGAWVPGGSGRRLASRLGFSPQAIREGLYGANPEIFTYQVPIDQRPKSILFVGRLIDRKGILELVNAFGELRDQHPEWSLVVIGDGPYRDKIEGKKGVKVHPFSQPDVIAQEMNQARVLALPSREEHWGLVVHEAALCGCGLLLTQAVGAGEDLVGSTNGIRIANTSTSEVKETLLRIYNLNPSAWIRASEESVDLARNFGPSRWADEFEKLLESHEE